MLAAPAPELPPARHALASLDPGTPIRLVTSTSVLADYFRGTDPVRDRVKLHGRQWQLGKVRTIVALSNLDKPRTQHKPEPGAISRMAGLAGAWDARLCSPACDLALIGTLAWLGDDLAANLGHGDARESMSNILLPETPEAATWSTWLVGASRLSDGPLLSPEVQAVVLDGSTATKYLPMVETRVAIAVLDRSVADESAAELVVQYRNSRREESLLMTQLGLSSPPPGIEVLSFTVPL
jgi:hypothetical protein